MELAEKDANQPSLATVEAASDVGGGSTSYAIVRQGALGDVVRAFEDFEEASGGPGGSSSSWTASDVARNGYGSATLSTEFDVASVDFQGSNAATLAFWLQPDGWDGATDHAGFDLAVLNLDEDDVVCAIRFEHAALKVTSCVSTDMTIVRPPLYHGAWAHVGLVVEGDVVSLLLNGEIVRSGAAVETILNVQTAAATLGGVTNAAASVDDVFLSEVALAGAELVALRKGLDDDDAAAACALSSDPLSVDGAGIISGVAEVDVNDCAKFHVTVEASWAATSTHAAGKAHCTIVVSLDDANDPPYFDSARYAASIAEDAPAKTEVGYPLSRNVTEPDPFQSSLFSLPEHCGDNHHGLFSIGACTGQIVLAEANQLDASTKSTYELCVSVKDDGIPVGNASAMIDVTIENVNDAPTWDEADPFSCSVSEDEDLGVIACHPAATDPDGDVLTYSLVDPYAVLNVSETTGDLILSKKLDYETTATYYGLQIFADDGEYSSGLYVTLEVADANDAPVWGIASDLSVDENAASGTAIGFVEAADPDGDAVTYSLSSQTPDDGLFTVTSAGVVVLEDAAPDYETSSARTWTLLVQADDGFAQSDASFAIALADVDEAPAFDEVFAFSAPEDVAVGSFLGVVSATDPDSSAFAWSCECASGHFALTPFPGEPKANVTLNRALDYETAASYSSLPIVVTDAAGNAATGYFDVYVTNVPEAPAFSSSRASPSNALEVDEHVLADLTKDGGGTYALTDDVTDPDGQTSFVFALAETDGSSTTRFELNGDAVATSSSYLDHEADPYVFFSATATDADGLSSSAVTFCVRVKDVDEAPTAATVSAIASTDAASGDVVAMLAGEDQDGDAVTYELRNVPTGWSGWFVVSGDTVVLAQDASSASDGDVASLQYVAMSTSLESTEASLSVTFDGDDDPPALASPQYFTVAEDASVGDVVGAVQSDAGVAYALTTNQQMFSIDASTGDLAVAGSLDFETASFYALDVTVSNVANSYGVLRVNVTDVAEAPVLATGIVKGRAEHVSGSSGRSRRRRRGSNRIVVEGRGGFPPARARRS